MDIDVLKTERMAIDIYTNDSTLAIDKTFEIILVNKFRRVRRSFGIVDLWNIRRKAKRSRMYR